MATPIISTLRKNQGYVLAVMGVVLIITWVIGPAALDFMSGGGGRGRRATGRGAAENPVVVQWNKGSSPQFLTKADIAQLQQEHRAVLEFVHRIVQASVEKGSQPQAPGLNLTPNERGQISLGLPMDTSEATVVNILLFAERGRELGIRVDKDAMVEYLKNLSGFSLREEGDFLAMAQETVAEAAKSNQLLSVDNLLAALRKELVSQQAQYMLAAAAGTLSTGELWEYHKQLNLRYKIEAYPVDVEKLKGSIKAADAKPEELLALFEKGKNNVPNPNLPEPGFRIPRRMAFGYCTVNFEPFLQEAKKNVSEAKALEAYTTGVNEGRYRKVTLPGLPDETKPDVTKPPKEAEEGKPAEKPVGQKNVEEKSKVESAKPAEKSKPEEDAKPAESKPDDGKPNCDDEPEAKGGQSATDEKKAVDKPAAESPAKDEAKSDPSKPSTTPPAAEPPAGETTGEPAKEASKPEEVKHKKFAEVRDEILTMLAQPEAIQLRDAAIKDAMDELRAYSSKLARYREAKQSTPEGKSVSAEDPGEFHPVGFAARYKFAYGKTNLLDQHEVENTDLGRAAVLRGQRGSLPFSQFAFSIQTNLYDPHDVDSAFGDTRYIYWPIADEPEQDVALETDGLLGPALREKVEAAWLHEKAFEAAKKRADELAAKAKAGKSLKDLVSKEEAAKVVEPFPFAMYTTDGIPLYPPFNGQPEFSRPIGIPMAGKEFMDAVFRLTPGEAGAAPDQPHKVLYAVRVIGEEPSLEIRREMFLSALQRGRMSDLMAFAMMEHGREMQGLFDDLEKHFGVKWMRPANIGGTE